MKFLAEFTSTASLEQFRLPEFLSVADIVGASIRLCPPPPWWTDKLSLFFVIFECDTADEVQRIAARCMLLRAVYVLFACTPTLTALYHRHETARASGNTEQGTNNLQLVEHQHQDKRNSVHPPRGYLRGGIVASGDESPEAREDPVVACAGIVGDVLVGEEERPFLKGDYHYHVETIGRKYSGEEKKSIIQRVEQPLQHEGKVNWKDPEQEFFVLIFHEDPNAGEACVFFCRLQVTSCRCDLLSKYDLKKRPYIGTTSMPPEESVVMANMGKVRAGSLAYDPFCGTGSLLVAAAHFKAHCFGTDMDGRAMRGGTYKSKQSPQMQQQRNLAFQHYSEEQMASMLTEEERSWPTMITNFKLYGLRPPDRFRFNFSTWEKGFRRGRGDAQDGGILDTILSDPPYGLREPRKKVEEAESIVDPTAAKRRGDGGIQLSSYSTNEVVVDLVLFAAEYLVVGGCLVFWHPTTDHYTDEELPTHPSMELIYNIPQRLSLKVVRRLVVMRKVSPVPTPPPARHTCLPKRRADDLRELMDTTSLPDNIEYMQYREKITKRREATTRFWREQAKQKSMEQGTVGQDSVANQLGTAGPSSSSLGNRRGRKNERRQTQEQIVANRERNIRIREEKQIQSQIQNEMLAKALKDRKEAAQNNNNTTAKSKDDNE